MHADHADHAEQTEEWRLRRELTDFYHLVDFLGWTELIFNHISVRLPGPEHHYLVNPFGLNYYEVTPENLLKVGVDGKLVEPAEYRAPDYWRVSATGMCWFCAITVWPYASATFRRPSPCSGRRSARPRFSARPARSPARTSPSVSPCNSVAATPPRT
jgi:hypothetical protein